MKANTTQHVKFKRLCRKLGVSRWQAIGLLESIWHLAASSAPAGDIGKHSNEDIAALIEWEGDEDAMVAALVDSGWLDTHPKHRLVVHDWHDHCPTFVKGVVSRSGCGFASKDEAQSTTIVANCECPTEVGNCSSELECGTTYPSLSKPIQAKPIQEEKGAGDARVSRGKPKAGHPPPVELPPPLNTPAFRAAWGEWHAYRREARLGKWAKKTCTTKLKTLAEMGHDQAIAAIEHSIGNGYRGIFAPSGPGTSGRASPQSGTAAERAAARRGEYHEDELTLTPDDT